MYKPFSWASGLKQAGSFVSGCVRETTSLNSLFTTCWGGWGADISTRRSFQFFTIWSIPEGSLTWAAVGEECQEIELHSAMKEFTDWFSVVLLCTLWVMSGQQSCPLETETGEKFSSGDQQDASLFPQEDFTHLTNELHLS